MPVPDAAVVSTARTAIGTAFKGTLVDVDARELGTRAIAETARRITLIRELRRPGGGTGVAALCAGGGMSTAVVLDVPEP
jgi:acetyl-CoA acetyltransferase